ncbi:unnamed protein product [Moneuplotes crassus]|uniref:DOMON domain-containing protein n=2 Tax=Euplotes crassus TaxID=5936 RepID=A0AAD1XDH7_EUPCR|nr:unnamed protein product [Moneuplotes crassus]
MKFILLLVLTVAFIGPSFCLEELVLNRETAFEIKIRAHLDEEKENFRFYVTMPRNYYVSVGFGDGMLNSPVVVIDPTAAGMDGVPVIHDAYSKGRAKPKDNAENIYTIIDSTNVGMTSRVTLQRPVVVQREDRDETIPFDETLEMIYAFNPDKYGFHGKYNKGFFTMKVNSGTGDVTFNYGKRNDEPYRVQKIVKGTE